MPNPSSTDRSSPRARRTGLTTPSSASKSNSHVNHAPRNSVDPPSSSNASNKAVSRSARKAVQNTSEVGAGADKESTAKSVEEGGDLIPSEEDEMGRIIISKTGNLLLEVRSADNSETFSYRVSSGLLKANSAYFSRLLDPDKFGEGAAFDAASKALGEKYGTSKEVPIDELPKTHVQDLGCISKVKSIKNLVADFLRALHGRELSTRNLPLNNLANLVVLADRFDALPHLAEYLQHNRYIQQHDNKLLGKANKVDKANALSEERLRQMLYISIMLKYDKWVSTASRKLILQGSSRWKETESDHDDDEQAMWWEIPMGIEDELIFRRERIIETIDSLQMHFVKLYASTERQCKLGYDSSTQCDSFQLGEMVRFFSRIGTLRLQGLALPVEFESDEPGSLFRILDAFRQCPSYQIDRNHTHCGLRSRLIPLLDLIETVLISSECVGICPQCWASAREEYAWMNAKGPLMWTRRLLFATSRKKDLFSSGVTHVSLKGHLSARDMFLAVDRDWTARDG